MGAAGWNFYLSPAALGLIRPVNHNESVQVIPAINAPDFERARQLVSVAKSFLPREAWLHFDLGDGIFSSIRNWGDPAEFQSLRLGFFKTEVHLMAENPEELAEAWLKAGVKRLIVHLETLVDSALVMALCQKYQAELMLAIVPETIVENLIPYFSNVHSFQILGVRPGKAGQVFQPEVLGKVEFLRRRLPTAKIEVDGGINLTIAKLIKEAGADMVASASYIFNSSDPGKAYQELVGL